MRRSISRGRGVPAPFGQTPHSAPPRARWTILLAGELTPTPRLLRQTQGTAAIAADAGMAHAAALGLKPRLWIGDFDSSSPALQERHAGVPRREHPAAKDETDGALAIAEALGRGAEEILLAGAFGGRTDQTFAHLTQIIGLAKRGVAALATSGREEAWPLTPGECAVPLPAGTVFSIIGLEDLRGLSLRGARWPLRDAAVAFGSTRTLSNVAEGPLEISLGAGAGVLLAQIPPAGR